jgi:hypothetical protein
MKLYVTVGLAAALGLVVGVALEASRNRSGVTELGSWAAASIPAVSAAPIDAPDSANVQLAADVEIEGRRFRVYVGRNAGNEIGLSPVWSVAIPADD